MKSLFQIVTEAEEKKPKKDDYEDLNSPEDDNDDDTGTDYTEEPDSTDDSGDDTDTSSDDETDPADEDGDSTDYTVDSEDVSPDDSEDDTSTDTDPDSSDTDSTEDTAETTPADQELSRQLIEDFSKLYHLCDNTVMKLTQVDKSNILVNQIVTRIISNINQIGKHLFDYIVYQFDKGKYPYNLYRYNQFVESFRINVEMLKKINVLTANSQNN